MPKKSKSERTTAWAQLPTYMTALTAVGALIFTGLSLNATNQQIALSEQGQSSDRFGKAVDQLAKSESMESRLGGIYSLEHLMRDAPGDQSVTIEILSAYVREHGGRIASNDSDLMTCPINTSTDIQAVLTVLGRRDPAKDGGVRIDINRTCLNNVNLAGLNFANANMEFVDLATSDLTSINFEGADLSDSTLAPAILTGANLSKSDLRAADLSRSDLEGANLSLSRMQRSRLQDAHFEGANLMGVQADEAISTGAHFDSAVLDRAVGLP